MGLLFCVDISLVESLLSMLINIGSNLNIARSTEQLSKVSLHIIKVSLFGESRFKYIVTLESVDRLEDMKNLHIYSLVPEK